MELTPQTLHAVEFREARRGGYNTRDVDDFLERVAAGVANLHDRLREIASRAEAAEARLLDAQHQIDELQRRSPAASSPIMAPAAPPPPSVNDTEDTLRRTLVLAQRTADATIKEAKQEARRGADHARLSAEAEIDELIGEREALKSDIDALRSHIDDQRDHIRAGIDELRRVLDDPHTFSPLPAPPLADVERGGTSPTMMPAAPPVPPEPDNGHIAAPDAGSPFDPGTRVASLQEAPETPPSQPMPFPRPDEARGPWLPSELRTSPDDEPPPPLPRRGAGPNGAPAVPGGPGDAGGRPSEWGRSVFDTEVPEGPEVPE